MFTLLVLSLCSYYLFLYFELTSAMPIIADWHLLLFGLTGRVALYLDSQALFSNVIALISVAIQIQSCAVGWKAIHKKEIVFSEVTGNNNNGSKMWYC
jgi:hypothetical protein